MKYPRIDNRLFIDNRDRFTKAMEKKSIAVIFGNPIVLENGDAVYTYKPNSDLFWMTGVVQEKTALILFPDHPDESKREILVILRPNEHITKWEGHKLSKEEAKEISGVKNIIYEDELEASLRPLMHQAEAVYLNSDENDRLGNDTLRVDLHYVNKLMCDYPLHSYRRASMITKTLRQIKNKYESDLIQQASNITHKALEKIMQVIKPGIMEYELEAELWHTFLSHRATRPGYNSILASGANACILHYVDNNNECKDGDLILMDFGAEYSGYVSDLSRTIPVNGKYTARQKEIYDAVLDVHNFAKSIIKPGLSFADYNKKVNARMDEQLVKIGLLTKNDIKNQDPAKPARRKYYYHGLGHHMGVDVHDLGWYADIQEGMVLTVEPGIYVEDEGIGVRIENDLIVTKTGIHDYFQNIPITTEEIEAFMKK